MQTLSYNVGNWLAEAKLEEVEPGKLLAVISVRANKGNAKTDSKHTVVFEHHEGMDKNRETEVLVHRLIRDRYGF